MATQDASGVMTFMRGAPRTALELARAVLRHAQPDPVANALARARWILCDLDGAGARWRLAIPEGRDGLHFPLDDFSDDAANYADVPSAPVTPPPQPAEG